MLVNLNSMTTVRLTDKGRQIWHDVWAPYAPDGRGLDHEVSDVGGLQCELWRIMNTFGPHMGMGFPEVFASTEIEIEDRQ